MIEGFENQKLNVEYIQNIEEAGKAIEYMKDTYEAVTTVYGTGKRFIGTNVYEPFMEYKHNAVGVAIKNRFKFERHVDEVEKIRLEKLMKDLQPKINRETVDGWLFN